MPNEATLFNSTSDLPATADVVVIGAGVIGASTAFQLSKRGAGRVVVVEQAQLGAGASGKSGALVRCHYVNPHEAALTLASMSIFQNWEQEVGHGSPGYEAIGFIRVVTPEDEERLRTNVAALQRIGVNTAIVDRTELAEIEPLMWTDDLTVAAFESDAGYADPNATLFGFAQAAARRGVTFQFGTQALAVERDGEAVSGVRTNRGPIATRRVVIAAGSWADRLLQPLGLDFGLYPVRSQVSIFRWPASLGLERKHRVVIDSTNRSWLRPEGDRSTLIGAEHSVQPIDPDDLDESVDAATIPVARRALANRFPVFANATMRGGWSGTFMRSGDDHPIIDQIPSVPGLWVMTGDSGSSFKTSPAIGICLAEWIVDGAPALVDLHPFRSTRYAEGQPWLEPTAYHDAGAETISR